MSWSSSTNFNDVMWSISQCTCCLLHVWSDRLLCLQQFMITAEYSVFCCHLVWLLCLREHEVSLLTFTKPSFALCQCERQSKRQAGEAVIQSEVLRISPGSSSFSNYPPGGILAVWDNNGSPCVRLSPLKCGWRKPTRGAGKRNVCLPCYVIDGTQ